MKCKEYITDRIFRNKKGYFSKPKKLFTHYTNVQLTLISVGLIVISLFLIHLLYLVPMLIAFLS